MTVPFPSAPVEQVRAAAAHLARQGYCPIPVHGKEPRCAGWPDLRLTEDKIPAAFQPGDNVGLVLGDASRGLVDVDLDSPEARALAPALLPPTGWRHGRTSSPASHWWYRAPAASYLKLEDPQASGAGACLVELRQDGHQTVVPPSVHPSGEPCTWEADGEIAEVAAGVLERAVKRVGAGALLARHWPPTGSRDTAALALTGLLTRAGWSEAEVDAFVTNVARAAGDEEWAERAKAARSAARLQEGRNVYGWPKLADLLGQRLVEKVCEWLGLAPAVTGASGGPREYETEHGRLVAFIEDEATRDGQRVLVYWRGDYYAWDGAHWRRLEAGKREVGLEARIVAWLERVGQASKITTRTIDALIRLLPSSPIRLPEAIEDGAWIGAGGPPVPACDLIPLANGQLHVPTRTLLPHTPTWFNLSVRPFPWEEHAECPTFRGALAQWFEGDPASAECLQEIMGYIACGRTDLEKAFYFCGPPRSGKSTVADVIEALVGAEYVASPSLNHLGGTFGLESLIGKKVIIFRDARPPPRWESSAATEAILRITGRDTLTINRKFRSSWKGQVNAPIVMISNLVARFPDASAAVASRFIHIPFMHSFLDKEDPGLKGAVLSELPGIFRWALDGLDQLTERGHFLQPESGEDARDAMERSASPVGAFVEEYLDYQPGAELLEQALYGSYRDWCATNGHEASAATTFVDGLLAYSHAQGHPAVRRARPGVRGERRPRVVEGIRLRSNVGSVLARAA